MADEMGDGILWNVQGASIGILLGEEWKTRRKKWVGVTKRRDGEGLAGTRSELTPKGRRNQPHSWLESGVAGVHPKAEISKGCQP